MFLKLFDATLLLLGNQLTIQDLDMLALETVDQSNDSVQRLASLLEFVLAIGNVELYCHSIWNPLFVRDEDGLCEMMPAEHFMHMSACYGREELFFHIWDFDEGGFDFCPFTWEINAIVFNGFDRIALIFAQGRYQEIADDQFGDGDFRVITAITDAAERFGKTDLLELLN